MWLQHMLFQHIYILYNVEMGWTFAIYSENVQNSLVL